MTSSLRVNGNNLFSFRPCCNRTGIFILASIKMTAEFCISLFLPLETLNSHNFSLKTKQLPVDFTHFSPANPLDYSGQAFPFDLYIQTIWGTWQEPPVPLPFNPSGI